jgi:signal transduction histidine kinase
LLSNAIKYSPPTSEIILEAQQTAQHLQLKVQDQGMGMTAKELEHIFEPFYRTHSAQHLPGTGLGLSIVKSCVERHQGQIEVQSQVGQGTLFEVQLGIAAPTSS